LTPRAAFTAEHRSRTVFEYSRYAVSSFELTEVSTKLNSVDAIKLVADGTVRTVFRRTERFPSTTLIRLYELLKNNSQLTKTDQNTSTGILVSIELN